jgi:hypothetical protein
VNLIDLLLSCLASTVYHAPSLIKTSSKHPGHLFTQILILNDPALISQLKKLITTKPSTQIHSPSGIPPHVIIMSKLSVLLNLLQEERLTKDALEKKLVETFERSIEKM